MAILRRSLFCFAVLLVTNTALAADHQIAKDELNRIFIGTWVGKLEVRNKSGAISYESAAELTRESATTEDVKLLLKNGDIVETASVIGIEDGVVVLMGEHGIRRLNASRDGDTYILKVTWESSYKGQPRYGTATYRRVLD